MPPVLNARLRFLVLAHANANRESIAVMTGACRRRQLGHLDALFNRLCEGAAVRSPPSRTTYLVIRRLFFNFCRSTSRSRFAEADRFDGRTLVNPRTRARISLRCLRSLSRQRSRRVVLWHRPGTAVATRSPLTTDRCVRDAHCVRPSPYSLIWIMRGSRRTPPRRRERPPSTQQQPHTTQPRPQRSFPPCCGHLRSDLRSRVRMRGVALPHA